MRQGIERMKVDNYGWNAAFYFWVAGALTAAVLMALLCNYKPVREKYYCIG